MDTLTHALSGALLARATASEEPRFKVDEWEIDAIYSASQKCLSCTPGLSPVSFSERVVEQVKKRKDKMHSWFMDMNLLLGYWNATTRTYHHTAPTR